MLSMIDEGFSERSTKRSTGQEYHDQVKILLSFGKISTLGSNDINNDSLYLIKIVS